MSHKPKINLSLWLLQKCTDRMDEFLKVPAQTPRFCLFVSSCHEPEIRSQLYWMLKCCITIPLLSICFSNYSEVTFQNFSFFLILNWTLGRRQRYKEATSNDSIIKYFFPPLRLALYNVQTKQIQLSLINRYNQNASPCLSNITVLMR